MQRGMTRPNLLWQGERHKTGSGRRPPLPSPGGNDYKLPPVHLVGRGRSIAGGGKGRLPEKLAGIFIKSTKLLVVVGSSNKEQASRCQHRTTIIFAARLLQTLRGEFGILSQRKRPVNFSRVEIDCVERPPGWLDRRVTFGIEKFVVAVAGEFHIVRRRSAPFHAGVDASVHIVDDRMQLVVSKPCKTWHTARAL